MFLVDDPCLVVGGVVLFVVLRRMIDRDSLARKILTIEEEVMLGQWGGENVSCCWVEDGLLVYSAG
jgi:hypothetical protein